MHARERLQATLAELQSELVELDELDDATRNRLQATLGDIVTALARKDSPTSGRGGAETKQADISDEDDTTLDDERGSQTLAERLNDATRGLESTHPELSTTLGGVINALAQMGI